MDKKIVTITYNRFNINYTEIMVFVRQNGYGMKFKDKDKNILIPIKVTQIAKSLQLLYSSKI